MAPKKKKNMDKQDEQDKRGEKLTGLYPGNAYGVSPLTQLSLPVFILCILSIHVLHGLGAQREQTWIHRMDRIEEVRSRPDSTRAMPMVYHH
jgi:hypothetical protein